MFKILKNFFRGWLMQHLGYGTIGADSPALLFGGGTDASPISTSVAGGNFADFRTKSTDATGADSRGLYWKHYLSGAGASGDCFRSYTIVEGAGAVAARGQMSSVGFGTNGTLAGMATGFEGVLMVPNKTLGGTPSALQATVWAEGSSSTGSGPVGFLRCSFGGDAAGAHLLAAQTGLVTIDGATIDTGHLVHTSSNTATHGINVWINGARYELLAKAL